MFIICLVYILWMSIDLIKENGFILKRQEANNITQKIWHVDYTNDLIVFANISAPTESLLYSLEQVTRSIDHCVNTNKSTCVSNKKEPCQVI